MARIARVHPLAGLDEIENIHAELAHHVVGGFERERALTVKNIMDMRLGDPDHPSQAALGKFAIANTLSKQSDESLLEVA
jgi:hypothetical protein